MGKKSVYTHVSICKQKNDLYVKKALKRNKKGSDGGKEIKMVYCCFASLNCTSLRREIRVKVNS